MTRLSQLGELGLLAELERRGLIENVEHDAALLRDRLVVTQDALVENVHFRLDWLDWRELGFRAAAVNLSDLAASGAEPEALLVTLAVPAATELADVVSPLRGDRRGRRARGRRRHDRSGSRASLRHRPRPQRPRAWPGGRAGR